MSNRCASASASNRSRPRSPRPVARIGFIRISSTSRTSIPKGLFDPEHERGLPPVRQALVRANPANGRKSIYIGSHAWYIEGLPYGESRRLLDELLAHTTRAELVLEHRWRQWDLVMWDNR